LTLEKGRPGFDYLSDPMTSNLMTCYGMMYSR
jgi:hypothetical protein